ncbi:MAG: RNA methyltransferase [Candidatus Melainabacteria bacterium]|nr:RNA methyltransferase [Candidatus Melainabacteria bacterium]
MPDDVFSKTTFVLVRPEFLGNIGSVARVLKNFGFADLRLVDPPKNFKDAEARMMAVGAFDLLKNAQVLDTLEEAIADLNLTVSTSSGRQRSRPLDNLSSISSELVSAADTNRLGFIFGNERNGLKDEEVALCNRRIRIESCDQFPSLNLAQAVGIVAYSLASSTQKHAEQPSVKKVIAELPDSQELSELVGQLDLLLGNIEFSRTFNKRLILQELKDAIDRMTPTRREAAILKGVLFRLNSRLESAEATGKPLQSGNPTEP